MAKAKKQRANRYEEKLKIFGDFENVIGVSVNVPPKKQEGDKGFNEGLGGAGEKELEKGKKVKK